MNPSAFGPGRSPTAARLACLALLTALIAAPAAQAAPEVSAASKAPDEPAEAQYRESDLEFATERAARKRVPTHTPEWTHPTQGDPGRKESGEKGGTVDINIGVGELNETDPPEPAAVSRARPERDD